MSESYDVVVVGGGVVGMSSAYYLNKAGARVLVIDRGRKVGHADAVHIDLATECVRRAVHIAGLDAAAREHGGKHTRPVIAAGGRIDLRASAALGGDHDQSGVEHAALVEIADERGDRLVVTNEWSDEADEQHDQGSEKPE